jgi:primosomal protein N' (replication factor Y)
VAGTRAAAFAPVRDLGLVAMWDDGDDLFVEPRAPYPHAREVLLLRAQQSGCAVLLGAHARSVEASVLVTSGWAREVVADRATVRAVAPRVTIPGASDRDLARDPRTRTARLPGAVHQVVRAALENGPVLVQAPRAGYLPALTCDRCRHPVRCSACVGPLRLADRGAPPSCGWCGRSGSDATGAGTWACPECGHHRFRAPVVGERRTAEELGRAFPRVRVLRSTGERGLREVDSRPAIVVATPGVEPRAAGGYAAAVLLDTWLVLARPDLRSAEEAFRRWTNAAALVRAPTSDGSAGQVVAVGDPAHPALQALVRWDPGGLAEREAEERASAHLPPASRVAVLSGPREAVQSAAASLRQPPGTEILGPVPLVDRSAPGDPQGLLVDDDPVRLVVRVPRRAGPALSRVLREMQGVRSARKLPTVRVQIDPWELG